MTLSRKLKPFVIDEVIGNFCSPDDVVFTFITDYTGGIGSPFNGVSLLKIKDKVAYVINRSGGTLIAIDISVPDVLSIIGTFGDGITETLEEPNNFVIHENMIYVISDNAATVTAIDITDPTAMSMTDSVSNTVSLRNIIAVDISEDGLSVIVGHSGAGGLTVIDVSNTNRISIEANVVSTYLTDLNDIKISGNYVYCSSGDNQVIANFDISDVADIVFEFRIVSNNLGDVNSIAISEGFLYVASTADAVLNIVDISDPTLLVLKGRISNILKYQGMDNLCVYNDVVYAASYLFSSVIAINVTDPDTPLPLDDLSDTTNLNGATGCDVSENMMFVACANADTIATVQACT